MRRTLTRIAAATAGVGAVITLAAGPAGAVGTGVAYIRNDDGAAATAKILLSNAVITGVTAEATASLQGFTTWDGKDETLLLAGVNVYRGVTTVGNDG